MNLEKNFCQSTKRIAAILAGGVMVVAVLGQEFRASITGTVSDAASAAVVGAKVLVTNVERNVTTETVTNGVGLYTVPHLLPGRYTLTVETPGFKKFVRQDIVLGINDRLGLDVRLEVGALTESVTVTGEAPILQTETASRGGAVEQALVEGLPNAGRNIFQVVFTQPGVYKPSTSQGNAFDIGSGIGNANPSINGASQGTNGRAWNTEVLIDGLADNRASREIVAVPALETVQELQVLTNMYDSSYGHTGGGVVSFVTKSGTNTLHGVVFDRVFDAKWRAKTWVENFNRLTKSRLRRHNYGFQVNGPVLLPKLLDGRNRLFFMLSWDKEPRDSQYTQLSNVPSAAMRNRDFSGLRAANGQPILIYDPLTTRLDTSGRYIRTPFVGNQVPAGRVDAVGAKILSFYPSPNQAGGGASGLERNLVNTGIQNDLTAQWSGRLDYRLNRTHSFFGRYTVTDQHRNGSYRFGTASPAEPDRTYRGDGGRHFTLDWTGTLSPTTTWTLRTGFARFEETAGSAFSQSFDPIQLGWPASLVSQFYAKNYPAINFGFYQSHGADVETLNAFDTYTLQPSVGKVIRNHVMKFGSEVRVYRGNRLARGDSTSGRMQFGRGFTQADPLRADALSGDEIATLLLGYPTGNFDIPSPPAYGYRYWVLFFQDDWKLTPKLALNLGLRWDYESPVTERYNRMLRGFAFDQPSPIAAQVKNAPGAANCPACADLRGGALYAAVGGQPRTAFGPDRNNFQPRIGVAYSLNKKTVLRGGYGLYYTAIADTDAGSSLGFSRGTPIISSIDGGLTPSVRLADPLAGGNLLQPIGSSGGLSTNLGLGLGANYIPRSLAASHQYSLGIQRELPMAVTLDASYVGNYSTNLPVGFGLNFIPANQLGQPASTYTAQVANPFRGLLPDNAALNGAMIPRQSLTVAYPQYAGLSLGNVPIGKNRYDSMQLTARRRFQSGLTFQVNYMITKTLEQLVFLNAQDVNLSDYSNSRLDKRLTPFDVPQRLSVIGVYDLPFGRGRRYANSMPRLVDLLFGGWTLGWNVTHQAGFPIDFPNAAPLEARSAKLPSDKRDRFRWFDTSLFPRVAGPAPFTLRDFPTRFPDVRFMDLDAWDLNLAKDIPFHERIKGQVRVTAINSFNHPYITQMQSTSVTSAQFGQLSVTQNNPPRVFYIDFRLVF